MDSPHSDTGCLCCVACVCSVKQLLLSIFWKDFAHHSKGNAGKIYHLSSWHQAHLNICSHVWFLPRWTLLGPYALSYLTPRVMVTPSPLLFSFFSSCLFFIIPSPLLCPLSFLSSPLVSLPLPHVTPLPSHPLPRSPLHSSPLPSCCYAVSM